MAKASIKLTPEELLAQSSQMADIQSSFNGLFSALNNVLSNLNGEWSEIISRNFVGKIQSAQKACSGIVDMFGNSSNAAKLSAMIFTDDSNSVDSILGQLMQYAEGEAFNTIDEIIKKITSGDDATILGELLGKNYDTATFKSIMQDIKSGNTEGVMQTLYEKGKDIFGDAMSIGSGGTWADMVDEMTGGKLGLSNVQGDYFKNLVFGSTEKAVEIAQNLYGDNPDYIEAGYQLGEFAWNFGPGAALDACGDAVYKTVSNIPIIGDYYAEKGATDAGSMFSTAYGEFVEMVSGNRKRYQR